MSEAEKMVLMDLLQLIASNRYLIERAMMARSDAEKLAILEGIRQQGEYEKGLRARIEAL